LICSTDDYLKKKKKKKDKQRKENKTKTDSKGGKRRIKKRVYGKTIQRSMNIAID
jgi:hypothetical protein